MQKGMGITYTLEKELTMRVVISLIAALAFNFALANDVLEDETTQLGHGMVAMISGMNQTLPADCPPGESSGGLFRSLAPKNNLMQLAFLPGGGGFDPKIFTTPGVEREREKQRLERERQKLIAETIKSSGSDFLHHEFDGVDLRCPRFKSLSNEEKVDFHATIYASLIESLGASAKERGEEFTLTNSQIQEKLSTFFARYNSGEINTGSSGGTSTFGYLWLLGEWSEGKLRRGDIAAVNRAISKKEYCHPPTKNPKLQLVRDRGIET